MGQCIKCGSNMENGEVCSTTVEELDNKDDHKINLPFPIFQILFCCIGIVIGIFIIYYTKEFNIRNVWQVGFNTYGADFYTDIYRAAINIENAIGYILDSFELIKYILYSLGGIDIVYFVTKLFSICYEHKYRKILLKNMLYDKH